MTDELLQKLNEYFNTEITKLSKVTENVTLFSVDENKYIVKNISHKCFNIYKYIKNQKIKSACLPLKQFRTTDGLFAVFKYQTELDYPMSKKVKNLVESLNELHQKTSYEKKLVKKNFKQLFRTYKKIDYKFQLLEMYVREAEIKLGKTDYDWIILSKYKNFLKLKPIVYNLQKKIHDYVDEKKGVFYCLNHGNPSINHFNSNKLISFDTAYLGVYSSDLAKLYVSCDHLNIDWFNLIDGILSKYENNFYKVYFKFLVLYIYIINLDFDLTDLRNACNKYIQLSKKISIFLKNFESYQ